MARLVYGFRKRILTRRRTDDKVRLFRNERLPYEHRLVRRRSKGRDDFHKGKARRRNDTLQRQCRETIISPSELPGGGGSYMQPVRSERSFAGQAHRAWRKRTDDERRTAAQKRSLLHQNCYGE